MARRIKVREINRDEELGVIRKEITLPNVMFETPSVSLKNVRQKVYPTTLPVNEVIRRVDQKVINALEEEGTTPFVRRIRSYFLPDKLNLAIFDFRFDSFPGRSSLITLAQTLHASSEFTIFLPTVKSGLLKEGTRLSIERVQQYTEMMRFVIDEAFDASSSTSFFVVSIWESRRASKSDILFFSRTIIP